MNYPPSGLRGWGPFVAHSRRKTALFDYLGEVGPQMTCCLLIETAEAVEHIEAILDVPGVDLAVVAQFDLSTALGVHGQSMRPPSSTPSSPSSEQRPRKVCRSVGSR